MSDIEKQFMKTLRLNMLELMNYSKIRRNKKRFSIVDVYNQVESIYVVSERKPEEEEIQVALNYLLGRSLIDKHPMGDVFVHSITDKGRELLGLIYDGDDTAVI
ncbi:MAG: hypothetical protein ACXAD7_22295 [Candidatus Kariarchaeaceae archaeon]|jgi:hypothetical protein